MRRLDDLIGKRVTVALAESEAAPYRLTLHGVEGGGVWLEGKELERLLGYRPKRTGKISDKPEGRPVFFIPYTKISFLLSSSIGLDEPSLLAPGQQ